MTILASQPRGYIAIVSATIISILLLSVALMESTAIFWNRNDQLDQEDKEQSTLIAESCIYNVLQQFAESSNSIQVSERLLLPFSINSVPIYCTINTESLNGSSVLLSLTAHYKNSFSSYIVQANTSGSSGILSVSSWRDITSTPP